MMHYYTDNGSMIMLIGLIVPFSVNERLHGSQRLSICGIDNHAVHVHHCIDHPCELSPSINYAAQQP